MFQELGLRHLSAFLCIVAATATFPPAAQAVDVATLRPQGYVSDFSQVVDKVDRDTINQYCDRVKNSTGAEVALVTLPSLEGVPIEEFANDLFRRWGIGTKAQDDGVLLLLVTGERKSRLEVGRGLEAFITDGTAGDLLRQMRPALKDRQFGAALLQAVQFLGGRISEGKGKPIDGAVPLPKAERPPDVAGDLPWPLIIFGLVVLLASAASRGRRRAGHYRSGGGGFLPGLLLGTMMGRHSSGRGASGGGFGGYDSGDSFGGFGGGDSGGGGASNSW